MTDRKDCSAASASETWTHGYNSCLHVAISALNYLSSRPRPIGGQDAYNAEHLLQIADEIKRTIAHNVKVASIPDVAQSTQVTDAMIAAKCTSPDGTYVHASMDAVLRALADQPPAAPVEITQHIGWLKQYAAGMNENNWRDMRTLIDRQLVELSKSAPAAPTGDTRSGERPPASAAMGLSAGADTQCSAGSAADVARGIVTDWLGMFDPPPQIDFQQSELLQGAIATALTCGDIDALTGTADDQRNFGSLNEPQPTPVTRDDVIEECASVADDLSDSSARYIANRIRELALPRPHGGRE